MNVILGIFFVRSQRYQNVCKQVILFVRSQRYQNVCKQVVFSKCQSHNQRPFFEASFRTCLWSNKSTALTFPCSYHALGIKRYKEQKVLFVLLHEFHKTSMNMLIMNVVLCIFFVRSQRYQNVCKQVIFFVRSQRYQNVCKQVVFSKCQSHNQRSFFKARFRTCLRSKWSTALTFPSSYHALGIKRYIEHTVVVCPWTLKQVSNRIKYLGR